MKDLRAHVGSFRAIATVDDGQAAAATAAMAMALRWPVIQNFGLGDVVGSGLAVAVLLASLVEEFGPARLIRTRTRFLKID